MNTGLTYPSVYNLALDPTTPTTLYAGTPGSGIFKSTTGGTSWTAVNTGLTGLSAAVCALALDPTTPTTLYAGTYAGVYKSTNGGGNWEAVNTGLTNLYLIALALDPTTPSTLYAGTQGGGVFKSTNGGGNWEAVNTGLTNLTLLSLALDPTAPSTLYAGTAGSGIFKSTTGGTSWTAVNTGLTSFSVFTLARDPRTPTTLYAGTWQGGVFKSINGGGSWQAVNTGLTNLTVRALALDPQTPSTLYAGTDGDGVFVLRPDKVGAFRPSDGTFYLDYNGNGTWEGCGVDRCLQIGLNGDISLVGDWNGTGTSKVGAFRPSDGTFYLDYNGNGQWDGCGTDRCLSIGMNGDIPLVGDWDGTGSSKVGAFRPSDGTFYLDYNGNGAWEGCATDRCLQIGMLGDVPLVGDWNGTGTSKVGAFRPSDGTFYLDYNGSGTWEGCGVDRCLQIGMFNDIPLVGDWDATGSTKVGAFRPSDGTFYLDYNGSGQWDGCGADRCLQIGLNGDTPLVGKW